MAMQKQKPEVTPKAFFERLVENALDFLVCAIEEFQVAPKYSVIHFSAAVELFLKARLMAEHWSLVVMDRTTGRLEQVHQRRFPVGHAGRGGVQT